MLKQAYLSVSSHLEELASVQQWFETLFAGLAEKSPWLTEQFDPLNLALAEGFTNAVRHAHADLPSSTPIDIELWVQSELDTTNIIEIRIIDRGEPFDPASLNEPEPGSLREGGYGWFLLRRLADQDTYDCITPTDGRSEGPLKGELSEPLIQRNCLRIVKTSVKTPEL